MILAHFDGERRHPLARRPVPDSGSAQKLMLEVGAHEVRVRVNDTPEWKQYMMDEVNGRWGVFAGDGAVRIDRAALVQQPNF
jgi:hypothetical protein